MINNRGPGPDNSLCHADNRYYFTDFQKISCCFRKNQSIELSKMALNKKSKDLLSNSSNGFVKILLVLPGNLKNTCVSSML